jgi:hypothetical protein
VWSQSNGVRFNIWANRMTPAGVWGIAQLIETDNAGDAFNPQIAIDASGNAVAVWQQSDGIRTNIWGNRMSATGVWGTAQLIETDNASNASQPQIAINASGNAVAVWQQSNGMLTNIWANRMTAAGVWGTAELIETDNTGDADSPQIAIDLAGQAVAVWQQYDGTRYNIWANRMTSAGVWGTAQLIETDAGDAYLPQIAIDPTGQAVAIGWQFDGTRYNIWANRMTAAGDWGTVQLIETDDAGNADLPKIAIDASGNAVAVWEQFDGTRINIWANGLR